MDLGWKDGKLGSHNNPIPTSPSQDPKIPIFPIPKFLIFQAWGRSWSRFPGSQRGPTDLECSRTSQSSSPGVIPGNLGNFGNGKLGMENWKIGNGGKGKLGMGKWEGKIWNREKWKRGKLGMENSGMGKLGIWEWDQDGNAEAPSQFSPSPIPFPDFFPVFPNFS